MKNKWLHLSLVLFTATLVSNPSGGAVIDGQAAIHTQDNLVEIHAGDKAIIHWQDFSIDSGEITRFIQPDASSAVLNKVVGFTQSMINGVLEANGKVILVNPHGVIIGKEGVIHTADFIASTADILDPNDWSVRKDASVNLTLNGIGASLINHEGLIEATGFKESNGRILLVASEVKVNGSMIAHSGTIEVLGENILLDQKASIDASGALNGGTVLIGGDYQGKNSEIRNSKTVGMHPDAVITASAIDNGNGGKVILWSDGGTDFRGSIFAKAGENGGDGGLIEISSKGSYIYLGKANASSPMGRAGNLLLDPCDITINAGPSAPPFTPSYNPGVNATVSSADIQAALVGGNNVTIDTASGVGGTGTITWQAGFPIAWATPNIGLTLAANADINVGSDLTCTGGGNITLNAPAGNINVTSGAASSSNLSTNGTASINLIAGGALNIFGSSIAGGSAGIATVQGSINLSSSGGTVTIGDVASVNSTNIQAGPGGFGNIVIQAQTGLNVIGGAGGAGKDTIIASTPNANTIHATVNTGNLTISSVTSGATAVIGGGSGAAVILNIVNGDLIMNSDLGGIASIQSNDHLDLIHANNMTVTSTNTSNVLVSIFSFNTVPSTVNLSGHFLANATVDSFYKLSFQDSPLTFTTGGDLTMHNTAPHQSGFFQADSFNFNVGGNWLMDAGAGGACSTVVEPAASLTATVTGNFTLNNPQANNGVVFAAPAPVSLTVGGDITINNNIAAGNSFVGVIASSTGPVFVESTGGSINLGQNGFIFLASNDTGFIRAWKNITMGISAIDVFGFGAGGPNLSLTLVVDNQQPTAPLIGNGAFTMGPTAEIMQVARPPIQIFTAKRSQNSILGTIAGSPFVPGAFDVNTNEEQWSQYFPQAFVAAPFTIFYKEPQGAVGPVPTPTPIPSLNTAFNRSEAVLGNMFDVLGEFEYPLPDYKNYFYVKYDIEKIRQYWTHMRTRRATEFNNEELEWVQINNYRKYHPYRKKFGMIE